MRLPIIMTLSLSLLAACSAQEMGDNISRQAARSVVMPIVQQRLPGPQSEAVTNCVLNNATGAELRTLALDIGTRAGTRTVGIVADVLRRPATVQCVMGAGIPGLSL